MTDTKALAERIALEQSNALLGCIIAAWPSKEMLPKLEQQYNDNLQTLAALRSPATVGGGADEQVAHLSDETKKLAFDALIGAIAIANGTRVSLHKTRAIQLRNYILECLHIASPTYGEGIAAAKVVAFDRLVKVMEESSVYDNFECGFGPTLGTCPESNRCIECSLYREINGVRDLAPKAGTQEQ